MAEISVHDGDSPLPARRARRGCAHRHAGNRLKANALRAFRVYCDPLPRLYRARQATTSRAVTAWRYSNNLESLFRTYLPANHLPKKPNGSAYSTRSSRTHACRTVRLKRVRMFPICEWPGNLNVGKIAAHFKILMFSDPSPAKWPSSKLHHDARAALDPAGSFDNFHVLAGRSEPFEGIRQRVPGIYFCCRSFDSER